MPQPIVTAIDAGSHALKVVQLRRTGHAIELFRLGSLELAELGRMEDSKRKIAKESALLRHLLSASRIRTRWAATAVSGRQVIIRYINVPPCPPQKLRELIRFEAEEESTGTFQDVVSDFWVLDLPSRSQELSVMIGMARHEAVSGSAELLHGAGLNVHDITLAPLALYYAFLLAKGDEAAEEEAAVIASVGAENIDLVIQRHGNIYFARNLTPAGRALTEALQDEFQLPYADAERMKQERGRINLEFNAPEGSEEERISFALSGAANNIAAAIQSSLMYFRSQLKLSDVMVDKLYITGGSAQLPGLGGYIGNRIGVDVEVLSPLSGLDLSNLPQNQLEHLRANSSAFAIAIGLAYKMLVEPTPTMSLLPESVKRRRQFMERGAYLWAAGALFLAALIVGGISSSRSSRALSDYNAQLAGKIETAKQHRESREKLSRINEALALETTNLREELFLSRSPLEMLSELRKLTPEEVQVQRVTCFQSNVPSGRPQTVGPGGKEIEFEPKLIVTGSVREKMTQEDGTTRYIDASEAQKIVRDFAQKLEDDCTLKQYFFFLKTGAFLRDCDVEKTMALLSLGETPSDPRTPPKHLVFLKSEIPSLPSPKDRTFKLILSLWTWRPDDKVPPGK